MTTALKEPPRVGADTPGRLFDPGGRRVLDDVVSMAWDSLDGLDREPSCLVCGATMSWNGDARVAECDRCGSTLQ